jgi:hypothetical protein
MITLGLLLRDLGVAPRASASPQAPCALSEGGVGNGRS